MRGSFWGVVASLSFAASCATSVEGPGLAGGEGGSGGAGGAGAAGGGGTGGQVPAGCGDGVIDSAAGETCDPPSSCPSACGDGDLCTQDQAAGSAAQCNVICTHVPITACAADGCCAAGCTGQTDPDCAACGNGIVEVGETCDGNCPTCVDGDACTADELEGGGCNVTCTNTPIEACEDGDGCCPDGCEAPDDLDCPYCGNGVVEPGETCDGDCPASCSDGKACTVDAASGSAKTCDLACTHVPIAKCAAGDGCCPLGCTKESDADCPDLVGRVYMASSNGSPGFFAYDIAADAWVTLKEPPSTTHSQLTTDGQHVLLLGSDNVIYAYEPASDQWSQLQPGPGPESGQPIGLFKWTPNGFYYSKDLQTQLWYSTPGGWKTVALPAMSSSAGTWDPKTGRLYIRVGWELGVIVFDTVTNTADTVWPNPQSCGENSRTGSYYDGFFYAREWSQTLQKMDVLTGKVTDTGVSPAEGHTSSDTDLQTGDIYFGPYEPTGTVFQVYSPQSNTMKTLASAPVPVDNHSTIVVVK